MQAGSGWIVPVANTRNGTAENSRTSFCFTSSAPRPPLRAPAIASAEHVPPDVPRDALVADRRCRPGLAGRGYDRAKAETSRPRSPEQLRGGVQPGAPLVPLVLHACHHAQTGGSVAVACASPPKVLSSFGTVVSRSPDHDTGRSAGLLAFQETCGRTPQQSRETRAELPFFAFHAFTRSFRVTLPVRFRLAKMFDGRWKLT